ncbi:hypothetical protein [Streptomyces sp. NPDC041003]|uniref:hypothetical protein n=1 Tax=Streptomyces sp. NPDC041003 TaxID=3155730 RepID=UPI0033FCEA13
MKTLRLAAAAGCVLLAAACGPSGTKAEQATQSPSPSAPRPVPAADKGPECVGDPAAKGLHVLRGGYVQLPGGAGPVLYKEAGADGTTRTAVLTNGTTTGTAQAGNGTETWPVVQGQTLTVGGGAYTVSQICTYRVVLTPKDQKTVTEAPKPSSEPTWPSLNEGRFRLRWHVPNNEYNGQYSAVVTEINPGPLATIAIVSSDAGGAFYPDARIGDTLEFAGRLWKVSVIDVGDGNPDGSNPNSGYVDLQLIGPSGG